MTKLHDTFNAILEGEQPPAGREASALAALASALTPAERSGPDPRFRARLRSELIAAASATADAEADAFALMLEGARAEVPAQLKALVAVAAALEPASLPVPTPAFRYGLRNKLVFDAQIGPSLVARARAKVTELNTRMRRSLRVVAASGMAATVLAGSGATFAAAAHSLPVDKLYQVKMAKEATELWFENGTDRGFVYLAHARTRLIEVRGMLDRPVTDQAPYVGTLRTMDEQTITGQTIIFEEFQAKNASKAAVEQVDRFARQQLLELAGLRERLPAGARPAATDSLTVLARVVQRAETVLGCDCGAPANALVNNPNAPQDTTFGCACSTVSGETPSTTGGSDGTSDGDTNNDGGGSGGGGNGGGDGGSDGDGKTVDAPDVPGTDADQQAEDLINKLLNDLPIEPVTTPVPVPEVSTPPVLDVGAEDQAVDTLTALTPSL